jgi:hypothetical protein
MNRWGLVAAALAIAALLGVGHAALAQGEPVRIVQSSDGTLYLVKSGARYTIVADNVSDDELATYPDAGAIGSAQLLAALSVPADGGDAGVASTPPEQPPAAPPRTSARPASIAAAPRFQTVSTVAPGGSASVTVLSAPGATCSLRYQPPSGAATVIGQQTADANGSMTWTFGVGNQAGVGTLSATCGEFSSNNSIVIGGGGASRK